MIDCLQRTEVDAKPLLGLSNECMRRSERALHIS